MQNPRVLHPLNDLGRKASFTLADPTQRQTHKKGTSPSKNFICHLNHHSSILVVILGLLQFLMVFVGLLPRVTLAAAGNPRLVTDIKASIAWKRVAKLILQLSYLAAWWGFPSVTNNTNHP